MANAVITGVTRGGAEWVPQFVVALKEARCIGCGRCYKVCSRDVFELVEREQDEEEDTARVMRLVHPEDCIGCRACSRVCPKSCHTHQPQSLAV